MSISRLNVWVDLINSLSFFQTIVSDPASNLNNLYFLYEATVSVQNASRSDTIQLSIISTIPNLSGSNLFEYISLKLKIHLSQPLKALEQFRGQF